MRASATKLATVADTVVGDGNAGEGAGGVVGAGGVIPLLVTVRIAELTDDAATLPEPFVTETLAVTEGNARIAVGSGNVNVCTCPLLYAPYA